MAVRQTLFRMTAKRTEPPERATPKKAAPKKAASKQGAARTAAAKAAPTKAARSKAVSKKAASGKGSPGKSGKAAGSGGAAAAGPSGSGKAGGRRAAGFWRRAVPASRAAKDPGPAAPEPPPRTPESRRPLLQRRSLGSVLARTAVLAVALVGMVAFAVALAKVTLVPSPASVHLIHTNLRPGASIRAYLDQPAIRDSVKQIGGNVLLGVPFGVLLPVLLPKARGLLRVVVITAFVMVLVEAVQGAIVEGRAFDIDDVILNTLGALLGYLLLGRRLGRALYPPRPHWWRRSWRRSGSGRSREEGREG